MVTSVCPHVVTIMNVPKSCVLGCIYNTAAFRHFCFRVVTEWDKRKGAVRHQKLSILYENRLIVF